MTITSIPELIKAVQQIRKQGWGVVDQELEIGFRTAAAPIHDSEGRIIAAINIGAHAARVSQDALVEKIVPRVLSTAQAIENDLRLHRGPAV